MLKKICSCIVLVAFVFCMSGCGVILGAALSAAAAYGISQATKK